MTIQKDWETLLGWTGYSPTAVALIARLRAQYEADQATMAGHAQCEANMDDQHEADQAIIRELRQQKVGDTK